MPYKVVIRQGKSLASAIVIGEARHWYYPNRWITVKSWLFDFGCGLLYFPELEDALAFAMSCPGLEIWEIEIRQPMLLHDRLSIGWLCVGEFINELTAWPEGTAACKSIKLIRRVA